MTEQRAVLDANVIISAILFPKGHPGQSLNRAMKEGILLISLDLLWEIARVLRKPKFDKYLTETERLDILNQIQAAAELIEITVRIEACRDPDDNKLLELALNGKADFLITGDRDLLVLNPFRGLPILTPADFLIRN